MIDRDHELPVSKQCAALEISRSSVYYEPVAVSASDLALMRRLDELHLEHPHAGSRMLRDLLAVEGSGQDRPSACQDADAANGDRGGLSQAENVDFLRLATRSSHICCAA